MLTRPQIVLLKRAQHDAGISDSDYRDSLHLMADVSSSKDPKVTDEHLDKLLAWFEAIYWRMPAAERRRSQIFQRPGYWAAKNNRQENSRDRFSAVVVKQDIAELERQLKEWGCGEHYLAAICMKVRGDQGGVMGLTRYRHALSRTLAARERKHEHAS